MSHDYHELLLGYSEYLRRAGHDTGAEIALRTQSRAIRDIIAYVATYNKFTAVDLEQFSSAGMMPDIAYRNAWLATLGRVYALQAFKTNSLQEHKYDIECGLTYLQYANKRLPKERLFQHFHRLEVELLARAGRLHEARELISESPYLRTMFYDYLSVDLENPALTRTLESYEAWLEGFNRQFTENGLAPLVPAPPNHTFNDLLAETREMQNCGPKVSVIMTSYRPDPQDLKTAVLSIIRQTYKNFELIVVDDASPAEYDKTLEEIGALDPRIRVVKQPVNGGTYRARNAGIAVARGEFISGQDSDDWSHPERLAHQVKYMQNNPTSPGVVVHAVRLDNDLLRTFPGRLPTRLCEVSLMLKTSLARSSGGYMDARKGADSEFRRRLETITRRPVGEVEKPLYLTRIGHESLSAADFQPGWSHPVRRSFWNATQFWHETTSTAELCLPDGNRSPIPIPLRFRVNREEATPDLDVVFLADWRSTGRAQRIMIDEIHALRGADIKAGIMQIESLLSPSKEPTRLNEEVQSMVNDGLVQEILPDDNAQATAIIVHDPSLLQFVNENEVELEANITLIIADIAPQSGDEDSPIYLPAICDKKARRMFKSDVLWSSIDPEILQIFKQHYKQFDVTESEVPLVLDISKWKNRRPRIPQGVPIIGRHSENFGALWPDDTETSEMLWPTDESYEVYILGDARSFLRKNSIKKYPRNWVVFRDKEITPQAFMRAIDFFIYRPSSRFEQSYSREAVEAVAAGAVTILPKRFKNFHGESALYVEPNEIDTLIRQFTDNPHLFNETLSKAQNFLKTASNPAHFVTFMHSLLENYERSDKETYATS